MKRQARTTAIKERIQSCVGKKMASVHFTTIPYEPYTAHKVQGKPYFCNICPCDNDILYAGFEDVRTFLYVFKSVVKFFGRYEIWVSVPVAIFFRTKDSRFSLLASTGPELK